MTKKRMLDKIEICEIIRNHPFDGPLTTKSGFLLQFYDYGRLPFKSLDNDAFVKYNKNTKRYELKVWYGGNLITKGCRYKSIERVIDKILELINLDNEGVYEN